MTIHDFVNIGDSAFVNDIQVVKGNIVRSKKKIEIRDITKSPEMSTVELMMYLLLPREIKSV